MSKLTRKLAHAREVVLEAYLNGATLRQIAEVHGVSSGTVRNCLIEQGADLRPRGRRKKAQAAAQLPLPLDTEGE